jgi:regulator of sigma E protease
MLTGVTLTLIAVFSFVLVLSFLVFFHELGHYSVARFFGIAVDRFSIGFGKPIWRRTSKAGVEWVVARIPLGGYVKFSGDAGAASNPDTQKLEELKAEYEAKPDGPAIDDIFHFRPVWQRALVVLAGPLANFILAIFLFAVIAWSVGIQFATPQVSEVRPDTPAAAAGFEVGDNILSLDGKAMTSISAASQYIRLRSDSKIEAIVERDGQEITLYVTPERTEIRDEIGGLSKVGLVGVGLTQGKTGVDSVEGPIEALAYGFSQTGEILGSTGVYLARIFKGKEDGKQLGSVVKIATVTGKVAVDTAKADVALSVKLKAWALRMAFLAASISIALGFANLMPLPVLDGGHLVYYGYEAVVGRPLSQEKQEFGFKIGFAVLLTLFVVLTINDVGYVGSIIASAG